MLFTSLDTAPLEEGLLPALCSLTSRHTVLLAAVGGVLLEVMGGRQSARTLHFISGVLIVGFIVIHVGLVIWTGLFNNMRSMITGWFVIEPAGSVAGPKFRRKPPAEGDAS